MKMRSLAWTIWQTVVSTAHGTADPCTPLAQGPEGLLRAPATDTQGIIQKEDFAVNISTIPLHVPLGDWILSGAMPPTHPAVAPAEIPTMWNNCTRPAIQQNLASMYPPNQHAAGQRAFAQPQSPHSKLLFLTVKPSYKLGCVPWANPTGYGLTRFYRTRLRVSTLAKYGPHADSSGIRSLPGRFTTPLLWEFFKEELRQHYIVMNRTRTKPASTKFSWHGKLADSKADFHS